VMIVATFFPRAVTHQIGENRGFLYSPPCYSSLATSAVQILMGAEH
jgi:hypothetical protein